MDLALKRDPDELATAFLSLRSPRELAELLEVPYKVLAYHLYGTPESQKYGSFEIPKKTGGTRKICAPVTRIKILQAKLNFILQRAYRRKPSVHGFVYERSIVSNAVMHMGREYVLNVDLMDFFPSINMGRVYGMFKSKPYRLPEKVAGVLAKLCTFDNQLPQGAPSSPIVSNMICARLDGELHRLASSYDCRYTRYADDLTFSTDRPKFPKALALSKSSAIPIRPKAEIGTDLNAVIEANGFKVNPKKVWLQPANARQCVTGLTVNEFPNVSRKYVSQIRAMLYAWDKYGLAAAENDFFAEHDEKHRAPFDVARTFKHIVKGKIDFLKAVRGARNPTYLKFCKQLAELDPNFAPIWAIIEKRAKPRDIHDAVFVIECHGDNQGTGFFLSDIGFITCGHVVRPNSVAFKCTNAKKKYKVEVREISNDLDIAILQITGIQDHGVLKKGDSSNVARGDGITVAGFPGYADGATIQQYPGVLVGRKRHFGNERMNVSAQIYQGASGSPVLNERSEVIGIAVEGEDKPGKPPENRFGVIPINLLDSLISKGKA